MSTLENDNQCLLLSNLHTDGMYIRLFVSWHILIGQAWSTPTFLRDIPQTFREIHQIQLPFQFLSHYYQISSVPITPDKSPFSKQFSREPFTTYIIPAVTLALASSRRDMRKRMGSRLSRRVWLDLKETSSLQIELISLSSAFFPDQFHQNHVGESSRIVHGQSRMENNPIQ